jgi:hypothetical protein
MVVILAFSIGVGVYMYRSRQTLVSLPRTAKREDAANTVAEIFAFSAVAAIRVKEFEDEGSHYFLRLADGRILFLSGQYLYEYENADEEDEESAPRFPCTQFDVVRHSARGYVMELVCRGTYLETEQVLEPFSKRHFEQGNVPEDMTYVDVAWNEIASTYS